MISRLLQPKSFHGKNHSKRLRINVFFYRCSGYVGILLSPRVCVLSILALVADVGTLCIKISTYCTILLLELLSFAALEVTSVPVSQQC